ncbi:hypothetical protein ABKS89_21090 [Pseudomonas sp. LABIM340]|uniref:hypothetical protein n=1 Tax=Pseudomonas sp. LABIM340 TaxID=3156585 RepID=UPI0032AF1EFE
MANLTNRGVLVFLTAAYLTGSAIAAEKIPCATADEMAGRIYSRITANALLMRSATLSLAGEDLKVIYEYSSECELTKSLMDKLFAAAVIAKKKEDERGVVIGYGAGVRAVSPVQGGVGVSGHGVSAPEINIRGNIPAIQQQIEISP